MRVLIIDVDSNSLDFAMRCQRAGHDVLWYDKPRKDGSPRMAGRGIIPKIVDYDLLRSKYLDWADLIFLPENAHYTEMLEPFRLRGYPIFGCCHAASEWELDRMKGQAIMAKAGLNTLPSKTFYEHDDAARFVEKNPTFLVSKPSGEADKSMSYVAHDAAELVFMLSRWKKNEKYVKDAKSFGFILQEKITGVEMAVGGFIGPSGWCKIWFESFEFKKLMNGDLGPNTGEMGTLSMYVKKSKLADVALKPLTKLLQKIDYVGYVDVNGMIDDKGEYWPFEFTMRPGWPGFHNMMACHDCDPAQWMLDLLNGSDTLKVIEHQACVSVVIAIPDFPYSHLTNKELSGIPVYHCADHEHVHLCEVMLGDDVPVQVDNAVVKMPAPVTTGDYVCVVTGLGGTIAGARRAAYSAVKKITMPASPFYRTDIGAGRLVKGLPAIQKHGFATRFVP